MNDVPLNSVLLRSTHFGVPQWLLFRNPVATVQTWRVGDVIQCLQSVERHISQGFHAAGFVSYEASPAMDPAQRSHDAGNLPLVWFSIYRGYEVINLPEPTLGTADIADWKPSISRGEYEDAFNTIKNHIRNGTTYQVNHTFRIRGSAPNETLSLFLKLHSAQRSNYSAYITAGRYHICSVSPELFLSSRGGTLTSRPMKGTVKRGASAKEDRINREWLHHSEKNRAENVMIVDMIRNDMGKMAKPGTVRAEELFTVEEYPTVYQMTSTVTARVDASLTEIIRNMFPCASITGAPKIKAMEIISELENTPRGIYTGTIGHITPTGEFQFNVAIRTLVVDSETGEAEYGTGGGIVWDSDPVTEYNECQAKAAVLAGYYAEFDLLETFLWHPKSGFRNVRYHLERLGETAGHLGFNLNREEIDRKLERFAALNHKGKQRVRLILSKSGLITVDSGSMSSLAGKKVLLARDPISGNSVFIKHKTTNRGFYKEFIENTPSADDVILWTAEGYATESTIANLVVTRGRRLVTPPRGHGLLPGVFRRRLLEMGVIEEDAVSVQELLHADRVYLINSLRGWMPLTRKDNMWIIESDGNY